MDTNECDACHKVIAIKVGGGICVCPRCARNFYNWKGEVI